MPGRRVILLEMSTEDAEEFVRWSTAYGAVGAFYEPQEGEEHLTPAAKKYEATIQAVVAKPTVWCRCDIPLETKYQRRRRIAQKREGGWSRGVRFGWWLCARCRKPSKAVVTHFITSMLRSS